MYPYSIDSCRCDMHLGPEEEVNRLKTATRSSRHAILEARVYD